VTMVDRSAADRACKDPNPIIDGRKANVNLAYLGAKPRVMQPASSLLSINKNSQFKGCWPALLNTEGQVLVTERWMLVRSLSQAHKGPGSYCARVSLSLNTHLLISAQLAKPSMVIPHVQPAAAAPAAATATSPYIDYTGAAYAQYSAAASAAAAVAYEQYPYAASPAAPGYMATTGYGYAVQQPLATAAPGSAAAAAAAFGQYQAQQLQADRMQ
ncbi:hypothetical protein GOODEAATRI_006835, partial [Goodea atripinnis]